MKDIGIKKYRNIKSLIIIALSNLSSVHSPNSPEITLVTSVHLAHVPPDLWMLFLKNKNGILLLHTSSHSIQRCVLDVCSDPHFFLRATYKFIVWICHNLTNYLLMDVSAVYILSHTNKAATFLYIPLLYWGRISVQ